MLMKPSSSSCADCKPLLLPGVLVLALLRLVPLPPSRKHDKQAPDSIRPISARHQSKHANKANTTKYRGRATKNTNNTALRRQHDIFAVPSVVSSHWPVVSARSAFESPSLTLTLADEEERIDTTEAAELLLSMMFVSNGARNCSSAVRCMIFSRSNCRAWTVSFCTSSSKYVICMVQAKGRIRGEKGEGYKR